MFDWVTETSRHVGTLVHRELDRWCRSNTLPSAPVCNVRRHDCAVELAELGVPPGRCDQACDRVITALEQTLDDERGRWLLGIDGRLREAYESELALSGVVDGQIDRGNHRSHVHR